MNTNGNKLYAILVNAVKVNCEEEFPRTWKEEPIRKLIDYFRADVRRKKDRRFRDVSRDYGGTSGFSILL